MRLLSISWSHTPNVYLSQHENFSRLWVVYVALMKKLNVVFLGGRRTDSTSLPGLSNSFVVWFAVLVVFREIYRHIYRI